MRRVFLAVILCAIALRVAHSQRLNGAGATFPNPLYERWFREYDVAHPGIEIHYRAVGSAAGIRQVAAGVIDFGATDAPMTDYQLASSRTQLIHIPALMGAVVPIFNLPAITTIRFTGEVLADIYLGHITKWNDERIGKDNPDLHLPDRRIVVVHRAEGSGTSYIFTDYLSKVSRAWADGPGRSTAPEWPTGEGALRNEGVARTVRSTEGAIGYVELIYARQNHLEFGEVRNAAGNWVKASIEGVDAAAAGANQLPNDYRASITNAAGPNAYPISSFTWLLIPVHEPNAAKAKLLRDLLTWIVTTGQGEAESLAYAPLPKGLASRVLETIASLR
ncbi:MAG TPA: phosphate ABC transporter substrate-binding protein PstS [Terracidiphilus sp.]|nr:phosphate ABC transporter substrate-binding protein PstS [Terracidiphilus sp.]